MKDKKSAFLLGYDAEFWAEILLSLKGYTILERRFKASGGEIDIIAKRFGTLAFVEVKARSDFGKALASITPQKFHRIEKAGRAYLSRINFTPKTIRCDAILIARGHLPRHIHCVAEIDFD